MIEAYLIVLGVWWLALLAAMALLWATDDVRLIDRSMARSFFAGLAWPLVLPILAVRFVAWLFRLAFLKEGPSFDKPREALK